MKKNIILLEDSSFIRSFIKHALDEHGFNTIDVESGARLMRSKKFNPSLTELGVLDKIKPDLFIIDIELEEGTNGLDVLRRLKLHSDFRETPVIVNSAHKDKETIIAAISAGAADYVLKEDNFLKILIEKVSRIFEKELSTFETTLTRELDWISYGQKELSFALIAVSQESAPTEPVDKILFGKIIETLKSRIRSYDWVFPLEKQNVALILPLSNVQSLIIIREKLINSLTELGKSMGQQIKVQIGFSHYPTNASNTEELLTIAKKQIS